MVQAIKVSKQGVDVLGTAGTVPNNLIFDSNYNTFKIVKEGYATVNHGTSGGTTSIAHSQSGVPSAYAFVKYSDGLVALPEEGRKGTKVVFSAWQLEVDGTNIHFCSRVSLAGTIKYYIFEAPGK